MRDHFDPLSPMICHNHEPERNDTSSMLEQYAVGINLKSPTSTSSNNCAKRRFNNSTCTDKLEILDCNILQSSLKRVRLSQSPGEFRLRREIETLDPRKWEPLQGHTHSNSNNNNDDNKSAATTTTKVHRSTRARLTIIDSLRICLFLPLQPTMMMPSSSSSSMMMTNHQTYHRDYQWRVMIQIPRMYPHRPPVVSRIDGLNVDRILINDLPPDELPIASVLSTSLSTSSSSLSSTAPMTVDSLCALSSTNIQQQAASVGMKTIEWNHWSPIIGLGELLDFILDIALNNNESYQRTDFGSTTTTTAATSTGALAVTMSSSSCDSSVSSSVSSTFSQGGRSRRKSNNNDNKNNDTLFSSGRYHNAAGISYSTSTANTNTTNNIDNNFNTVSFLSPNRFDVGYHNSEGGYEKYNHNPTSFAVAATTRTTTTNNNNNNFSVNDNTFASFNTTSCIRNMQQEHQQVHSFQYRESEGNDEVDMDINGT